MRRRRSSDINRERTESRRESYGSSYRLDRSESRDRSSHHNRDYQERHANDSCARQETDYDRRFKRESSHDIPIKRENSHDSRIKRESSHSAYSRPSDRDMDRGNAKEWGRNTYRSRSRGRSEIRDRAFDSNHTTYDGNHLSSSNGQLQSGMLILEPYCRRQCRRRMTLTSPLFSAAALW